VDARIDQGLIEGGVGHEHRKAGLLGGFTTYASFALQSAEMLATGRVVTALGYVAATVLMGLAAVWAGLRTFG
jgi:CrcB protein